MTLLDDVIAGATGDIRVASLLRQVKILASRTGADPLEDWIGHELDGYPEDAELPSYRGPFVVPVLGHFFGPFQSQMTNVPIPRASFGKELDVEHLFEAQLREPIARIETMAAQEGATLAWSGDMINLFNWGLNNGRIESPLNDGYVLGQATMPVSKDVYVGALDGVRNRVLDLALQLEKVVPVAGQATTTEAEQAFAGMIINNHFHASSNVAIASTDVKQSVKPPAKGDLEGLVDFLQEMGLSPDLLAELRAAAKGDEEDQGEGPDRWKRVRRWFASVATDAGTEAIGGAVATAAIGFLGG
ncbi:hypothetical protein EV646_112148 [Kribbella antiqua]|uniref:AbiTii domain-containing protein n=1 Tax=Kribbella antiqua TaxID=2512217 RepID=A0A4R2IFQ3_9ACTN|nr:hypothetical protein [Kribbella antiqua]TCO43571.1 hypothetical protein EV646_112148 [Kribbella antiqua]